MKTDGYDIIEDLFGGIMSEGSLYEGLDDISIHATELIEEADFQEKLANESVSENGSKVVVDENFDSSDIDWNSFPTSSQMVVGTGDKEGVGGLPDTADRQIEKAEEKTEPSNRVQAVDVSSKTVQTPVSQASTNSTEIDSNKNILPEREETEDEGEDATEESEESVAAEETEEVKDLKKRILKYYRVMGKTYEFKSNNPKILALELKIAAQMYIDFKKEKSKKDKGVKENKKKEKLNNTSNKISDSEAEFMEEISRRTGIKLETDSFDVDKSKDKFAEYNSMTATQLMSVVKPFLIEQGVEKHLVDINLLAAKFGKDNIRRLIKKNYIVALGSGVSLD